ncbi:MAG: hypothetical protein IS632_07345 [Thaumarchaeota archaeon]|nr:hypothetical protein [Nitrososphaerota archaeon]
MAEKHRDVSKWHLAFYIQSFQFVHNPLHYGFNGGFLATPAMVLVGLRASFIM